MSRFIHENVTMLIIGDHPHKGELGHPVGKSKDTVTQKFFEDIGEVHYEILLENCPHLIESCYVPMSQLQLISGGGWKRNE